MLRDDVFLLVESTIFVLVLLFLWTNGWSVVFFTFLFVAHMRGYLELKEINIGTFVFSNFLRDLSSTDHYNPSVNKHSLNTYTLSITHRYLFVHTYTPCTCVHTWVYTQYSNP